MPCRYASLNTQPAESTGKWAVNTLLARNTSVVQFANTQFNMTRVRLLGERGGEGGLGLPARPRGVACGFSTP